MATITVQMTSEFYLAYQN